MSRFTHLPILPTPGLTDPRFTRLRFMTADAGAAGTAGASDASATDAASAVDSDATGTTDTTDAGTGDDAGSQADQGDDANSPWNDPAKAKAEIERLRRENGADRTNAKQTAAQEARDALAQDIGKALGLVKDDAPTDPAVLATKAQEATEAARAAQVELAVFKAAQTAGANPVALLDRNSFTKAIAGLDPTAADFDTKVAAAITAATTADPTLRAQAAGASSVDHAGGSGEKTVRTPKSLTDAVASRYGTA
ncbi:hypothetical protein [Promicromonospora iranensis]|uniref:Minor structural protein GP20 n=1 Tax=Promicromonospora iranensis TaxID=1105144 RepID=A0ABU2CV43_9MICO|nr:hypothetical protein [Promicromonospora iranensis]MDR7385218.1 hypothetical protein [Promicromonospora iranensis]